MFVSGAERDRINSRVLVIISSKSDNGLDGGLYTRIIIRSGLSIFTMSKSHTELEYFRPVFYYPHGKIWDKTHLKAFCGVW